MIPADLSCQEVAAANKPVTRLVSHLDSQMHVAKRGFLTLDSELSSAKNDFELDDPLIAGKQHVVSNSWSSEFFLDEQSHIKNHENYLGQLATNGHDRHDWVGEFSLKNPKGTEARWAAEFDHMESIMDKKLSLTEEQQLNELFDQFESLWDGSKSKNAPSTTWRDDFSNDSRIIDGTDPDFQMFESLWNSKGASTSVSSSRYVFEENNPFINEEDPLSIGLEIFHTPTGSLTEAALAFEAAIQKHLSSTNDAALLSKAWFFLGNCQAENEKESAALVAYEESLLIDPENADALLALAVSLTNEAYDERVIQVLMKWLGIVVNGVTIPSTMSRDALISALLDIINRREWDQKLSSNLQMALGLLFYSTGEFDRSIDCFQASVNIFPGDYLLWNRLGATLANNHQSERAIAMYEKALSLKPSFVRALHNLGVSCMNVGCYMEAADYLIRALKAQHIHPNSPAPIKNISTNLWETLRRTFIFGDRIDLAAFCESKSLDPILTSIEENPHWLSHGPVHSELQ